MGASLSAIPRTFTLSPDQKGIETSSQRLGGGWWWFTLSPDQKEIETILDVVFILEPSSH